MSNPVRSVLTARVHTCAAYDEERSMLDVNWALGGYGPAVEVDIVLGSDGHWWADNGEYATPVRFCPWCGIRLDASAS